MQVTGPDYLTASDDGSAVKSVRFSPAVTRAATYRVYLYFPKIAGASGQTIVTVSDGSGLKTIPVREGDIRVEGQTSGEWVSLGAYRLSPGKASYVDVSTKDANGLVVADAALFVPAGN